MRGRMQQGDVGHVRSGQRNLERSASAPQVHKPCEGQSGKPCMRVTKVKCAAAIAVIIVRRLRSTR
eukprot:2038805-Pleurochrysis_carterae.AAC.1